MCKSALKCANVHSATQIHKCMTNTQRQKESLVFKK